MTKQNAQSLCGRACAVSEEELQERREKIFDSACDLLQRSGYANLTVERLARHAGISKKTIYQTFESKEILLRELMQERLFLPMQFQPFPPNASLAEELASFMRQLHTHCTHPRNLELLRLLIGETERAAVVETTLRELIHLSDQTSPLNLWLMSKKQAGLLAFENLEETAARLFGLVLGAPFISHLLKCVKDIEDDAWIDCFIQEGVRVFLAGYGLEQTKKI